MSIEKFKDGSVLYTGSDMSKALLASVNKRNNYRMSCDFCIHNGKDEECDGCSLSDGESLNCSCHINPPCSRCVNLKFEPTPYLINFHNYHGQGRRKWECFPTTKEVFEKFKLIEDDGLALSAEILQTGEIAIYLGRYFDDKDEIIEICEKVLFKQTATKIIQDFKL